MANRLSPSSVVNRFPGIAAILQDKSSNASDIEVIMDDVDASYMQEIRDLDWRKGTRLYHDGMSRLIIRYCPSGPHQNIAALFNCVVNRYCFSLGGRVSNLLNSYGKATLSLNNGGSVNPDCQWQTTYRRPRSPNVVLEVLRKSKQSIAYFNHRLKEYITRTNHVMISAGIKFHSRRMDGRFAAVWVCYVRDVPTGQAVFHSAVSFGSGALTPEALLAWNEQLLELGGEMVGVGMADAPPCNAANTPPYVVTLPATHLLALDLTGEVLAAPGRNANGEGNVHPPPPAAQPGDMVLDLYYLCDALSIELPVYNADTHGDDDM